MALFRKRREQKTPASYDDRILTPVIRCSICTGEQVAGFRNKVSGRFEEVMLLRNDADLQEFRNRYGITGNLEKFY